MRALHSVHHQCVCIAHCLHFDLLTFLNYIQQSQILASLVSLSGAWPGASRGYSGVFCLMQRRSPWQRISTWRQMRSTNAWGLTFGEDCCAPGPDRGREMLLWSWDRWRSEDWKHSSCQLIKDSAGELQYESLQPQHYSGRLQKSVQIPCFGFRALSVMAKYQLQCVYSFKVIFLL